MAYMSEAEAIQAAEDEFRAALLGVARAAVREAAVTIDEWSAYYGSDLPPQWSEVAKALRRHQAEIARRTISQSLDPLYLERGGNG